MTWLLGLWNGVSKWFAIAGAFIAAVGAAILYGLSKGKASAEQKNTAEKEHDAAQAAETRNEIEREVDAKPVAPTVRVGDAPPDSAAGELSSDWSRDKAD